MRESILRQGTFVLVALLAGIGLAVAQDQAAPARNPAPAGVDPATQNSPQPGNKPEQNATQEPSSRAATAPAGDSGVLVNGALNVPGAPIDGEAVPAKFSARNDADDQLATVDYTFKTLTPEQRLAIYRAVAGQEPPQPTASQPPGIVAKAGAELPPLLALQEFAAAMTAQFPQLGRYRYAMLGDKLLLVEPNSMYVVGVFSGE
jgi:hypothetical protein